MKYTLGLVLALLVAIAPTVDARSSGSSHSSSSSTTSKHQSAADQNTAANSNQSGGSSRSSWFSTPDPKPQPTYVAPSTTYHSYPSSYSSGNTHIIVLNSGHHVSVYHNYQYGSDGYYDDFGHWVVYSQPAPPIVYDNNGSDGIHIGIIVFAAVLLIVVISMGVAFTKG